ncbi:MAG: hypothetical protein ACE5OY_05915 [Candidatus Bathyarchaeia archaeon]
MRGRRIGEGRIREEKLACPIFDVFRKHGVDYRELCVSLGNGWLHAISPNLRFDPFKRADKDHYYIKDIVEVGKKR